MNLSTFTVVLAQGFVEVFRSLVPLALADDPLATVKCAGLPGCGAGGQNILLAFTIPVLVTFLLQLATALALVYIVYMGIQMLGALGDEGKVTKARWGVLYALLGLGLAILSGSIVSLILTQPWAGGGGELTEGTDLLFGPVGIFAKAIAIAVRLFNVAFAIVVVIAGYRMAASAGKADEFNKGLHMVLYAIVGAILVNLAKAIVFAFLALNIGAA